MLHSGKQVNHQGPNNDASYEDLFDMSEEEEKAAEWALRTLEAEDAR